MTNTDQGRRRVREGAKSDLFHIRFVDIIVLNVLKNRLDDPQLSAGIVNRLLGLVVVRIFPTKGILPTSAYVPIMPEISRTQTFPRNDI